MKLFTLSTVAVLVSGLMAVSTVEAKGKPECPGKSCEAPGHNKDDDDKVKGKGRFKTMICHWEGSDNDDEEEEVVEDNFYKLLTIPEHAAAKHLSKHELDFNDLITWAADLDADGFYDEETVVIACESPGEGYVLIGEDSEVDPDDADPDVPVVQEPPPEPEPLPEDVEEISLDPIETLLK